MRACVLVVTVTACWSATPAPPTTPAASEPPPTAAVYRPSRGALSHEQRCAKSLGSAFDISRAELASSGLGPEVVDEIQDAFVTSCEVMQWTDEILECVGNVDNVAAWQPCQNQMTQEQRDDSMKRAFEILQRRNAIPSSGSTSTPP